jgi:predicted RNA methylase
MPKPTHPLPRSVRRVLKRILPDTLYRRHVGRHKDESLFIWRTLAAQVVDGVILDIGAYHGEFSLAARAVNDQAALFAFEPNPNSLAVLRPEINGQRVEVCGFSKKWAVPRSW